MNRAIRKDYVDEKRAPGGRWISDERRSPQTNSRWQKNRSTWWKVGLGDGEEDNDDDNEDDSEVSELKTGRQRSENILQAGIAGHHTEACDAVSIATR